MSEEKKTILEFKNKWKWNKRGIPNFEVLTNRGLKLT